MVTDELPIFERLLENSKKNPDKDALVSASKSISYQQLVNYVEAQAHCFSEIGISADSIVGICCADEIPHLLMVLSVCRLGATSFTVPSYEPISAQKSLAERCGLTHYLDMSNFMGYSNLKNDSEVYHQFGRKLDLSSTSLIYFSTSGTTGKSKIVMHADTDIVAQSHRHIQSSDERFACLAAVEHNFSKRHRLYCLVQGATNVFLNADSDFIEEAMQLSVNVLHLSVFQAQQLLAHPRSNELQDIRIKLGGSHANNALRKQLRSISNGLQAGYGTTETGAIAFTDKDDTDSKESVGQALPGIKVQIVDDNREPLPEGKRGEIAIAAKGMFRGYLGEADLTQNRLDQGWFYTGDLGYVKKNKIYLSGRTDDMFVFSSINIYPQELESVLNEFPGIKEISVIPKASGMHGNIPIALVVFKPHVSTNIKKLKRFSDFRLGIRSPKEFVLVKEIPKNRSGKVSRINAISISNKSDLVRSEIADVLMGDKNNAGVKKREMRLFTSGKRDIKFSHMTMDSLLTLSLLVKIETKFNVVVSPKLLSSLATLNALVAYVLSEFDAPAKSFNHTQSRCQLDADFGLTKLFRLFQRLLNGSSIVQFNQALVRLEAKLTPQEIEKLFEAYNQDQLLPKNTSENFRLAVDSWFYEIRSSMFNTGLSALQVFRFKRIAPAVKFYSNGENPDSKTLIVGFCPLGIQMLDLPTPVILQHLDADQYDLMLVVEAKGEDYESGLPYVGKNEIEIIDWLSSYPDLKKYKSIRTLGSSAGAYLAILAAYRLQADVCLSIGGRFHKEVYLVKVIKRLASLNRAIQSQANVDLILCHSSDNSRDKRFSRLMSWLSSGRVFTVEMEEGVCTHSLLNDVSEYKMLAEFFRRTLLIDVQASENREKDTMLLSKTPK